MSIKEKLQSSIEEAGFDYKLKENYELVEIISEFGFGETEFHTADIERLIKESEELKKAIGKEND